MRLSPPSLAPLFLTLRSLRTRWNRTALTLLGIVLGVAVVLATQITNQTVLDSLRQVFDRATGQASLMIVPSSREGEKLSESLLADVQKVRGVLAAAPSIRERTLLSSEVGDWQIAFALGGVASGNMFFLYGIDPQVDPQLRVYQLTSGRLPEVGKYEVVIPNEYAQEKNLVIGNFLELLDPEGVVRLKIVGLLANEGVALLNNGVVGFAPLKVVQDEYGRGGEFDEIALRVDQRISENPRTLESLKQELGRRIGKQGDVVYPGARGQLVSQMLATYQLGLSLFSMIAVFVGAFLIYNTFSMTVAERTREIGMLRAIGMSRWMVLRSVLSEALLYSLVGSVLGVGVGILLARGLIVLVGNVVTPQHGLLSVTWQGLVEGLGVGVGVTVGAAFLPAWRAAHISPLEALRVRSRSHERINPLVWISGLVLILIGWVVIFWIQIPDSIIFPVGSSGIFMILFGATLSVTLVVNALERLARPLATRLYGNEGAIGSANVRRSVVRTTLTVASLMVALTMIISITSVSYSFRKDMGEWIDSVLGGDLYVRAAVPMRESFARNLQAVAGVAAVTPTRVVSVRAAQSSLPAGVTENTFYFNAIDPLTYRQIADMQFAVNQGDAQESWVKLERGGALFVTNVTADRYRLQRGDNLTLLTRRGEQAFRVAAIVMDYTGQGNLIYGTYNDLHSLFAEQGADRFTLKVVQGYSIQQVSQEIQDLYKERKHISVQTTQAFKDSIMNLVNQAFRLFDVLSLIGVIIGGMGVVNTLTMNVLERQQEIGALRSLGMTRRQVTRMVLAEALALGIMGAIYGLVFGYVQAQVTVRGMNLMVGYDLVYRVTATPYVIGILIALGVAQVAAFYPARRAASVNIVEAIKHE
jgi:putative ABC transport system permease protein